MCSSSHCRRTDRSALFFRIKFRDGFPDCAKAVLQEVALDRQLTNGLQHLVPLFLCSGLLPFRLSLRFSLLLKNTGSILQKLRFPVADHVGIQIVLGRNRAQLPFPLQYLQDNFRFEFSCVLSS